jgi:hypothetical protein
MGEDKFELTGIGLPTSVPTSITGSPGSVGSSLTGTIPPGWVLAPPPGPGDVWQPGDIERYEGGLYASWSSAKGVWITTSAEFDKKLITLDEEAQTWLDDQGKQHTFNEAPPKQ